MRSTCFVLIVLFAAPSSAGEVPPGHYLFKQLEQATELDLFSLDPSVSNDKDGFHGYKILGKTTVKDAETRKGLVAEFKKGIDEKKGAVANCFTPRHGVRFKLRGATFDLVICFQCFQVKQFFDDKMSPSFFISKAPQPAFDKVLKDAGIELPKQAEK